VVNAATGQVAERIDYDEFGNVIADTKPGFQPFGFAGGLYDQDTKLVHFSAREYDPSVGRWTTKDPTLFGGGDTNLYGYVIDDPVNLKDPSGLDTLCRTPAKIFKVGPLSISVDVETGALNISLDAASFKYTQTRYYRFSGGIFTTGIQRIRWTIHDRGLSFRFLVGCWVQRYKSIGDADHHAPMPKRNEAAHLPALRCFSYHCLRFGFRLL
jgi:RHS repeat-associated protein